MALGIYLFVQACRPGDPGDNEYGPPPTDNIDAVSVTPAAPEPDHISELERLTKLHRAGVLTDAEFEQRKAAVLSGR